MLLDGLPGEVRGCEVAKALESQVPHVGFLVSEVATEKVAGTNLKAGVTVGVCVCVCVCVEREREREREISCR